SSSKQYAQYEGREDRDPLRRPERFGRPQQRRTGPGGPNRPGARPGGDRPGGGRPQGPRDRSQDRQGPGRNRGDQSDRRERREPVAPLPELEISLVPDEKGVESLARQIKMTGRAYPLFDIAQMILQKPERHAVAFSVEKN